LKLHMNKNTLKEAVSCYKTDDVAEENQAADDILPTMNSPILTDTNTSERRNSLEASTKATTAAGQAEPAPPHSASVTPRRIVISLPKYQPHPPVSPTFSSSTVDSPVADTNTAASTPPITTPKAAPQPSGISGLPLERDRLIVDGVEEFLAQKRALKLQHVKEEEEQIKSFVRPLENRIRDLQRSLKGELERNVIFQARHKEAISSIDKLNEMNQRLEVEVQEERDARDVAEHRGAKIEQDLRIALSVHARELGALNAELEKVKREAGDELSKLKSSLEIRTKEKEMLEEKWSQVSQFFH
jgi:hypothetical protein